MVVESMGRVLRQVDELNRSCWRLRAAYLDRHPDAPLTRQEQEYRRLLDQLHQRRGMHGGASYAE
jgi:hypothetical protein